MCTSPDALKVCSSALAEHWVSHACEAVQGVGYRPRRTSDGTEPRCPDTCGPGGNAVTQVMPLIAVSGYRLNTYSTWRTKRSVHIYRAIVFSDVGPVPLQKSWLTFIRAHQRGAHGHRRHLKCDQSHHQPAEHLQSPANWARALAAMS